MKHKHYDCIVAWAEGKTIQLNRINGWKDWLGLKSPDWDADYEFRIKPEEKRPVVRWQWIYKHKVSKGARIAEHFMTEEEAKLWCMHPDVSLVSRAEWTRTEFEE